MPKYIDYKATAMNFRALRMRRGYRAIDVAKMLSVSPSAVTRWETGGAMPTTGRLVQIADLYGVSVDDLFIRRIDK